MYVWYGYESLELKYVHTQIDLAIRRKAVKTDAQTHAHTHTATHTMTYMYAHIQLQPALIWDLLHCHKR